MLSHVWLFAAPWTVALQSLLSVGFSRQEYWSGLPFSIPGDLPDPGIKPASLCLLNWQADCFTTAPPEKPLCVFAHILLVLFLWRALTPTPSFQKPSEAFCASSFHNSSLWRVRGFSPLRGCPLVRTNNKGSDEIWAVEHFRFWILTLRNQQATNLCHYCSVGKSCATLCDPMTVARQASLSMRLFCQEYWSGLPFPSPGLRYWQLELNMIRGRDASVLSA